MRVNAEWQARQIAMTKAKIALNKVWEDNDLSVLEWLSVLSDELSSMTNRHRNQTEMNPVTGPVGATPEPTPEPGEPAP